MPRFFVNPDRFYTRDGKPETVSVTGEDARHIARSLRMASGETLTVCDGEGNDFLCRLSSIHDDECVAQVISVSPSRSEPPCRITVYQALVRSDRFDTVIQKSVEYGATAVVPFVSSRCVLKLKDGASDSKRTRNCRIALEAAKQCGRGTVPAVAMPISYDEMLKQASCHTLGVFCYEGEHRALLGDLLGRFDLPPDGIAVIVGPEGGFSPEEAEQASQTGLCTVGLGERILRTESAAAFVLACISCKFELTHERQ